ncbi:hypothetical protein M405DRAFT_559386 [Rhizopogon salebrosus TDB-379]|nr:hypothetical protein M405DRAFT_559386 [Rhizopogon salebrosus TDB-379]
MQPSPLQPASLELLPLISHANPSINEENIPIVTGPVVPRPRPIKIVITNPLSTLALAAAKVILPPPLEPDPEDPTKPSSVDTGANANNVPKATSSKVKSGGKAVKMRPSATKNGRNLCALRWLKNLKTNGTTEEFCIYYGALTSDQRKQYDDEAIQLVANNSWSSGKAVCDGQLY